MPKFIDKLSDSDEEIARVVQSGDVDVFGVLIKRYEKKMLRYAKKFLFDYDDAEDIVQEVFLKAYINIQSFDTGRKFSSWLYRIAHNEFINAIKKKKRQPLSFFDPDTLFPRPVSKENADTRAKERELSHMLDKCLNKLDAKYREPLILYYFEEMSYREIADVLRVPIATVGIRLQRGKKIMRKFCENVNYNNYD
jgi:RNA polymerase sigma-70 factor (ECF subfamily)